MVDYKKVDLTDDISSSDFDEQDTQAAPESINLIDEQAETLKQIFAFGSPKNEDDDDPYLEVGDRQKVPRTLFTFKALIYD